MQHHLAAVSDLEAAAKQIRLAGSEATKAVQYSYTFNLSGNQINKEAVVLSCVVGQEYVQKAVHHIRHALDALPAISRVLGPIKSYNVTYGAGLVKKGDVSGPSPTELFATADGLGHAQSKINSAILQLRAAINSIETHQIADTKALRAARARLTSIRTEAISARLPPSPPLPSSLQQQQQQLELELEPLPPCFAPDELAPSSLPPAAEA
ncbi:hypothetical protein HK405_001495 [Cladochytrium tenue]|nr:hypothetical protein HK405_001495 [Cladochytrium tenue]